MNNKGLIIVRLMGGMGNQMFQWALAKRMSIINDTEVILDTSFLDANINGVTKRNYSLNKFTNIDALNIYNFKNNGLTTKIFTDPEIPKLPDYDNNYNLYLNGYFQSDIYFKDCDEHIRKDFKIPTNISDILRKITGENSISMHIRRTDYLTSNGFHPVQNIKYYEDALSLLGDYEKILVFSDDIQWCRENLKFERIEFIEGNEDVVDIWLMSLCRDNIIANSSFSWWGAWLNNNPNKKVIAPSNWFASQQTYIIPNNWIKI
jgi:hypothetical protein